jgi:hypothetical protein
MALLIKNTVGRYLHDTHALSNDPRLEQESNREGKTLRAACLLFEW